MTFVPSGRAVTGNCHLVSPRPDGAADRGGRHCGGDPRSGGCRALRLGSTHLAVRAAPHARRSWCSRWSANDAARSGHYLVSPIRGSGGCLQNLLHASTHLTVRPAHRARRDWCRYPKANGAVEGRHYVLPPMRNASSRPARPGCAAHPPSHVEQHPGRAARRRNHVAPRPNCSLRHQRRAEIGAQVRPCRECRCGPTAPWLWRHSGRPIKMAAPTRRGTRRVRVCPSRPRWRW